MRTRKCAHSNQAIKDFKTCTAKNEALKKILTQLLHK